METLLYRTESDKSWNRLGMQDVNNLDKIKDTLFVKYDWKLITIRPRKDTDVGMVRDIVELASRRRFETGSYSSDGRFLATWKVDVSRQLMILFAGLALLTLPVVALFHPMIGIEPVWLGAASFMRSKHMRGVI